MHNPTWARPNADQFTTTWHGETFVVERFDRASWHLHRDDLNELGHHPDDSITGASNIPDARADAALALNGWRYSPGHRAPGDGQPLYERLGAHRRRDALIADLTAAPKAPVSHDMHAAYRQHTSACRTCRDHTIWEKHTRCAEAGHIDRDRGVEVMAHLAGLVDACPGVDLRDTVDGQNHGFHGWVARFAVPGGITGWAGYLRHARRGQSPWQVAAGCRCLGSERIHDRHDAYPLTGAQVADAIAHAIERTHRSLNA